MLKFLYNYVRSMRLYYGFVTATTVLVGASLEPNTRLLTAQTALLYVMGFVAWGANQIFSDWCDRKEDAINAPHRPMVTGALAPLPAMALSAVLLLAIAVTGFLMSPKSLAFLALGGVLNIAYSFLKRVPVLNFLVYAAAITCCAFFGYVATADAWPNAETIVGFFIVVFPAHALMCHNSYYKDVAGDRAAGVRTLQTLFPQGVSLFVSGVLPALVCSVGLFASIAALVAHFEGCATFYEVFITLFIAFPVGWLALSFHRAIRSGAYHRATCRNCQLCVFLLAVLEWPVAFASLVAIQLLFLWYRDEKE